MLKRYILNFDLLYQFSHRQQVNTGIIAHVTIKCNDLQLIHKALQGSVANLDCEDIWLIQVTEIGIQLCYVFFELWSKNRHSSEFGFCHFSCQIKKTVNPAFWSYEGETNCKMQHHLHFTFNTIFPYRICIVYAI